VDSHYKPEAFFVSAADKLISAPSCACDDDDEASIIILYYDYHGYAHHD